MNRITATIIIAAALIIILAAYIQFNPTGLFGFGAVSSGEENKNTTLNTVPTGGPPQQEEVSLNLTYEILSPSKISISALSTSLPTCPDTNKVQFTIKNMGGNVGIIKIIPQPTIKVTSCKNCTIENLARGEEKEVALNACKISTPATNIRIVSSNADELSIRVQ